jgi:hypothetical protein
VGDTPFGALTDACGAVFSYITPAVCSLIVAGYGVFDLASKSRFADVPQTT